MNRDVESALGLYAGAVAVDIHFCAIYGKLNQTH